MTVDVTLDAMAVVSVDELSARAGLLSRCDRKYLVPVEVVPGLLGVLAEETSALEIDGRRRFRYETTYFDTPGLRSFHDTARGRPMRWKLRVRSYLDGGEDWLEVKLRDRRGRTVKHRQPRRGGSGTALDHADLGFAAGLLATAVDEPGGLDALRPALRTSYERVTLFEPASASRVTIDRGLRCELPGGSAVVFRDAAVVETKTTGRPSAADRVLWAAGRRPRRFSKYGTGLVALRRELPSNRWHRTLRSFPAHEEACR